MDKKINPLKIAGMLFCVAAAVMLGAFVIIKIYTGGQIKTIDKLYTAVTRGVYTDYRACLAEGALVFSESEFEQMRGKYQLEWGEDFHLKADYVSRKDVEKGVEVTVKTTVYNDDGSESKYETFVLVRQNGKWLVLA